MRVLLLGGTTEAAALARLLAREPRLRPVLSYAGRTAAPAAAPIPTRSGGFGGAEGLAAWLRAENIGAVVDATHPFAARISANAARACDALGLPRLVLLRPEWREPAGAGWVHAADAEEAAGSLGPAPRRVLLTIGRQDLAPFARRTQHAYWVRSVDPPDPALLPPGARTIVARGPFDLDGETALLRRLRVNSLVSKNSGASAVAEKLAAARAVGVQVVMIARPSPPPGRSVAAPEAALAWLLAHAGTERGV